MSKHRQLSHDDHVALEALLRAGRTKREIASVLHVHLSTVYRAVARGLCDQVDTLLRPYKTYSHIVADAHRKEAFSHKGAPIKIKVHGDLVPALEEYIIKRRYSPAAVSATLKAQGGAYLSENTIYRYINRRMLPILRRHHLPEHGIRKHPWKEDKEKKQNRFGTSIEKRPAEVAERSNVGNWELDSVVGKAKGKEESVLVFTERKSRLELVFKVPDKSALSTVRVIDGLDSLCDFPTIFQSITMDNGSEFSNAHRIEHDQKGQRRTYAYYCHPYTSCERGSNENANRLLRRWLPKGKSLKDFTPEQALELTRWMNNYPRQILGWKTPAQVFIESCQKQGIKISPEFSQYLS